MKHPCRRPPITLCAAFAVLAAAFPSWAQARQASVPRGWIVDDVRVVQNRQKGEQHRSRATGRAGTGLRALTVTRQLRDGADRREGTAYNRVRAFNPVPSIDSGIQFPFGLDGIGGYGSEFSLSAVPNGEMYGDEP